MKQNSKRLQAVGAQNVQRSMTSTLAPCRAPAPPSPPSAAASSLIRDRADCDKNARYVFWPSSWLFGKLYASAGGGGGLRLRFSLGFKVGAVSVSKS